MIKFRNVVRKANKAKDIFDAVVVYVGLGLDGELMTNYKIELNHARLLDPSGSTSSSRGRTIILDLLSTR
jgi:hypothetical protein